MLKSFQESLHYSVLKVAVSHTVLYSLQLPVSWKKCSLRMSRLIMKEVIIIIPYIMNVYVYVHSSVYLFICKYVLLTELEDIRREKQELEESCQLLEQQLQHQQDQSYSERRRELQARRCRQEELERRICILEEQKRRLSSTKEEVKQASQGSIPLPQILQPPTPTPIPPKLIIMLVLNPLREHKWGHTNSFPPILLHRTLQVIQTLTQVLFSLILLFNAMSVCPCLCRLILS